MNVEQKLEQGILGKPQLKPDEQKKYLGTFRERVVLAIMIQDAAKTDYQALFRKKLGEDIALFANLSLKINDNLDNRTKIQYLKIAKELNITATVISENTSSNSNACAVVVCSNQAENIEKIELNLNNEKIEPKTSTQKTSLLSKLFGH